MRGKKSDPPKELTIEYDLFELPSAQHKAGYAQISRRIERTNEDLWIRGQNEKVSRPTYAKGGVRTQGLVQLELLLKPLP